MKRRGLSVIFVAIMVASLAMMPTPQGNMSAQERVPGEKGWTIIMTEDFEGDFPGTKWKLLHDPTWGKDDYNPYGGSYSVWCAAGGIAGRNPETDDYIDNMSAWMQYGPFDLGDATEAEVVFMAWLKAEFGHDGLNCMASTDGDNFWGSIWSGDYDSWRSGKLDLTDVPILGNLCGQPQVWIAFRFISDDSATDKGVFLDDIVLRKRVVEAPIRDDFCDKVEVTAGTIISGDYSRLYDDDNSYLKIKTAGMWRHYSVDWHGEATVPYIPSQVKELTITYRGKYSCSVTQKLYLYNFITSNWDEIDSSTVGTSDAAISSSGIFRPEGYISAEGQIRARVYAASQCNFTAFGDYLKFTLKLPALAYVLVTPSGVTLAPGGEQQFKAQGYDTDHNPIPGLTFSWSAVWTENGIVGTIDTSGKFTTGSIPGIFVDAVEAETTFGGITKAGYATVIVTPPPPVHGVEVVK